MWYCEVCRKWHFSAVQVKTPDGREMCLRQWKKICPHANTFVSTTGRYHYCAGEVWDDLHDEIFCTDCGKKLSDKELSRSCPAEDREEEVPF